MDDKLAAKYLYKSVLLVSQNTPKDLHENIETLMTTIALHYKG